MKMLSTPVRKFRVPVDYKQRKVQSNRGKSAIRDPGSGGLVQINISVKGVLKNWNDIPLESAFAVLSMSKYIVSRRSTFEATF